MVHIKLSSFNTQGIDGRDIAKAIGEGAAQIAPGDPSALAIGFQEVFFDQQLAPIRKAYLGDVDARHFSTFRTNVRVWQSSAPGSWAVLAPKTPNVLVPGFAFTNSSGLALCVQGRLLDAYFARFRYAQTPDAFASKGILVARVRTSSVQRVIINTHLNNATNDHAGSDPRDHGRARAWQVEQLASHVRWIDRHWRAPIMMVGDFNIDSIRAARERQSAESLLYTRLLSAGRARDQWWWDVNARLRHDGIPIATTDDGKGLDLHLLDRTEGRSNLAFASWQVTSDHKQTVSEWDEP